MSAPEPLSAARRKHRMLLAFAKTHYDGSRSAWAAGEALDQWSDALNRIDALEALADPVRLPEPVLPLEDEQ